ncbi:hypothetical protein EVAR_72160_1 [Eumeta japonica]|uniref:Uncharacterized protein n=1 Tax=Eumeta variegata TaxID=151549 RepID=A0A4C1SBG6_EUMVA|nr:hypothetical protein EVAR_72160_1 [Eumeta japonica]
MHMQTTLLNGVCTLGIVSQRCLGWQDNQVLREEKAYDPVANELQLLLPIYRLLYALTGSMGASSRPYICFLASGHWSNILSPWNTWSVERELA